MTAQISDSVRFENEEWSIAALKGGPFFQPSEFGLEPVMSSTACWRGFYCQYEVAAKRLTLQHLEIGVARKVQPLCIVLNGQLPTKVEDYGICGDWKYQNIALPIPFSGGLILCRGFLRELYVHMGFHPAWKFEHVRELIFRDGALLEAHDRSETVALLRAGFLKEVAVSESAIPLLNSKSPSLHRWIEKCFSLDYEKSGLD